MSKDLEKLRAKKAWDIVSEINRGEAELKEKYSQEAQGFPVDIISNGLLQTLAFYRLGGDDITKKARRKLAGHLENWLFSTGEDGPNIPFSTGTANSVHKLISSSGEVYRQATLESLAFLQWLKRFSKMEE